MDEQLGDRDTIIARYSDGPNLLESAIAGLSENKLDITERTGSWTIRQIVHHVADGDDIWKLFIKRAIGNPGGKFDLQWYGAMPQDEWVKCWAYPSREIGPSLALFRASRGHIVQLLERIPEVWERSMFVISPNRKEEEVQVGFVVKMQTEHVAIHVENIRKIRQLHGV